MEYEFSEKVVRKLKIIKRKNRKLIELIQLKLKIFELDERRPSLRLHKLGGAMKDTWSISINESIRMIFYYKDKNTVIFSDIEKHEEVYKH